MNILTNAHEPSQTHANEHPTILLIQISEIYVTKFSAHNNLLSDIGLAQFPSINVNILLNYLPDMGYI